MKGLSKGLPALGEGGQRQVRWEQGLGLGASEAQCTLTTQAAATSCLPGQCTL